MHIKLIKEKYLRLSYEDLSGISFKLHQMGKHKTKVSRTTIEKFVSDEKGYTPKPTTIRAVRAVFVEAAKIYKPSIMGEIEEYFNKKYKESVK